MQQHQAGFVMGVSAQGVNYLKLRQTFHLQMRRRKSSLENNKYREVIAHTNLLTWSRSNSANLATANYFEITNTLLQQQRVNWLLWCC